MNKYLLILLATLFSCNVYHTPKKALNCEPEKPICSPGTFNEVKFDTLSNQKQFFIIKNIDGLSTEKNEYSLSFYNENDVLLTYDNGNIQEMQHYKWIEVDIFSQKNIVPTVSGPNGIASIDSKNNVYLTAEPNYLDKNKRAIYEKKANNTDGTIRIPISEMPGRMRIFSGKINDDKISNIEILNSSENLGNFDWEGHPAISPNGRILFFASTRKDTFSSVDLYMAEIDNEGNATNVRSLGDKINTPCDEFSPFVSKDSKRLYFSSMGHNTVGGYDLFYCEISDEFWKNNDPKYLSNPINVGKPVNTKFDELFPSSPEDPEKLLYYASNQNGNKNFDMFVLFEKERLKIELGSGLELKKPKIATEIDVNSSFKEPEPLPLPKEVKTKTTTKKDSVIPKKEKEYFSLEGQVKDEKETPIPDANIKVKKQGQVKVDFETVTDKSGKYRLSLEKGNDYEVVASDDKHFYDSYYIDKEETETNGKIQKDFSLTQTFNLRINFPYDVYNKPYKFIIDNTGHETTKSWEFELNDIASNIKKMQDKITMLKITGHTDMNASQAYNYELGLNRAKFVASELIKRGIPKEKIEIKSAGKLEPLDKLPNENDEIYDKRLRRVNLEILRKK